MEMILSANAEKGENVMEQWFLMDEHKMEEFKWHVVDMPTLLAAIEAKPEILPEDWKIVYGSIEE